VKVQKMQSKISAEKKADIQAMMKFWPTLHKTFGKKTSAFDTS